MSKIKTNIKMRVTPGQSQKVQEICFKNGIRWRSIIGERNGNTLQYLNEPFLYINDDNSISYGATYQEKYFSRDKNKEVSAELFIRTNGTCVEPEDTTEPTPTEEPQPKTLSEYLKENKAYESFVENCVESFLKGLNRYKVFKSENNTIRLSNIFSWAASKGGQKYWENLHNKQPKNLVYDMNEIIFAEVDRRLAEQTLQPEIISAEEFVQVLPQKPLKRYMVFVEGKSPPRGIHNSYDSAEKESKRLSAKAIGCNVFVVEIVKTFKSKVIVEEF